MKQNLVIESNGILFTKSDTGLCVGEKIEDIIIKNFVIITSLQKGFWNKLKFAIVIWLYKDLFLKIESLGYDAGISIYKEGK